VKTGINPKVTAIIDLVMPLKHKFNDLAVACAHAIMDKNDLDAAHIVKDITIYRFA
jgi:hypothetical protein